MLVACEYSGTVRDAFIANGDDAMSCDLLDTTVPGPHLKGDVREYLEGGWDLMIAHPPCTHLAVSGARWFKNKVREQREAMAFVKELMSAAIPYIALENPVSVIATKWRKPDQIVQPWMFGDEYTKTTCLWLKGLPLLQPSKVVGKGKIVVHGGKRIPEWYSNRTRPRDMTFPGMAAAMAAQWGGL